MEATLKNWMEVVQYKITEGSEYGWNCYGENAYSLDSWNGEQEGYSMTIVFDTKTQEVYEVQVCDFSEENYAAYRYMNPKYVENYKQECQERNVTDEAWEDVHWVELELFEDWVEKASAIRDGKDYDKRILVPITLEEKELHNLTMLAHKADMSLNQFINKLLSEEIKNLKLNK